MFEFLADFDSLRIVTALVMLGIVVGLDIKTREIDDRVWMVFGAIAGVLLLVDPTFPENLINIGIAMIIAPVAIAMWRFGLFGGADAFAIIVLVAIAPQITLSENIVTPFTVLTNAVLLSVIPLFVNLGKNTIQILKNKDIFEGIEESKVRKAIAMLIGYKAKNPTYSFSLEVQEGSKTRLDFSLQHAENTEYCTTPHTWVTPGLPYLLYIAGGFVLQILFGDLLFGIIKF